MATYLTPTASQTVPLRLSLSPDGEYLAIALRNNVAEIFRLVEGTWRSFAVYDERLLYRRNLQYDSICAMSWHPMRPFQLAVVYAKGTVYCVTFDGNASGDFWTEHTVDLTRSLNKSTTLSLRALCFNDEATEVSAAFGDKFLAYSNPWGGEVEKILVYGRDSLRTHITEGDILLSSYIGEHELLLVYPAGFLAVSTSTCPPNVLWDMTVSRSRTFISGGTLSPDKRKFLAITAYKEVEVYDLGTRQFIAKITHSNGPFRSITMAVYLDRDSIALVHDQPQGDEHQVDIILCLDIGQVNTSFRLHVGQTEPDTPRDLAVLHPVFHGGLIEGRGHLIFVKDLLGRIAVICPEALRVNLGTVRIRFVEPVDEAGGATRGPGAPMASLVPSEPTFIFPDSGAPDLGSSSGADLENVQEQRDLIIDDGNGHGPGANVARDHPDGVNTQDAAPIAQHVQDVDFYFAAEFSGPAVPQDSEAIVLATGDPFITAFAFILHFLIACITIVCYIAVATALFSRFER